MREPPKEESSRVVELDVLRGLAALGVLLGHYAGLYDHLHGLTDRLGFSFKIGGYAVHLFFVISGYVILMSLERCKTGWDFLLSRFSRIFPAYWGALVITFFLLHLLKTDPPRTAEFLVNFTMLQRLFGYDHLDAVYWTLNVELSFYFWMFVLFMLRMTSRLNLIVTAALLFQLGAALYQTQTGIHFSQALQAALLLEYANLFCAGMIFYRARQDGLNVVRVLLLVWCLINTHFVPFRGFEWAAPREWGLPAVAIIFLVFWAAVSGWMPWLKAKSTVFLGTISYTLYLLHDEIGRAIMIQLSRFGWHPWLGFLSALACVLFLATGLTFLLERPALRWIRARYSSWKSHRHDPRRRGEPTVR